MRKARTTLVPPILRPEILAAVRAPGEHVLVYQTSSTNTDLIPALQSLPHQPFRLYGMGRAGVEGNVTLCSFSETGFVEDLRTARAVIAGGGYSLMGEAVHLRVPMLSMPIGGQYEQELNARYLQQLGYGAYLDTDQRPLVAQVVRGFLARTGEMTRALAGYQPRDNSMLFACIDELLHDVDIDEPAPTALQSKAMGAWEGPQLPAHLAQAIDDDEEPSLA